MSDAYDLNVSISQALSYLKHQGIDFSAVQDQIDKAVAEIDRRKIDDYARQVLGGNGKEFPGKLVPTADPDEWREKLFALAADMVNDFKVEKKRMVGFPTPTGVYIHVMVKREE